MKKDALWTADFLRVSAANFFLAMTFYMLLVSLPIYVIHELGATEAEAGLITTAFLVSAIIVRFLSGQLIDHFGQKKVFAVSLFLFMAATCLYPFVTGMGSLLLLRLFHGIGFGIATTASGSIAAGIVPPSRRGEGMGYFLMTMNIAMAIGPFVGLAILSASSIAGVFYFCIAVSVATFVVSLFLPNDQIENSSGRFRLSLSIDRFIERSALPIALTAMFFAVVYSSILSFVSVYGEELELGAVSGFFFVLYAVALILSRPFTGRWFDQYGAKVIVYPCVALFSIGLFLLSQATGPALFLIAAAVIGIGWGTLFPSFQTIAIANAAPKRQSFATATYLAMFDIGIGFGSVAMGAVAAGIGFNKMYGAGAVYVLIGGVIFFLATRYASHQTEKQKRVSV